MKTPAQRRFETEAQRKADERDQKHTTVLLWSFLIFILACLAYNFLKSHYLL
ncbi:MAG TPA: hypothetical protein VIK55_11100 [Paludibacter sp.]